MATFESIVEIQVVIFRPIGSVTTTTVEMKLHGDGVEEISPGSSTDRGVVTLVGSYFIKVRKPGTHADDGTDEMRLKFFVTTHDSNPTADEYLLQGIAFSNRNQKKSADVTKENRLGQFDFPKVELAIENTPLGNMARVFTITNRRSVRVVQKKKASYDYLFLIQRVSDGAIGIIDPEWENE